MNQPSAESDDHKSILTLRFEGEPGKWIYIHPGKDQKLDTDDDVQLVNTGVFPTEEPFDLQLKSEDAPRGMFIGELELVEEFAPGKPVTVRLEGLKSGTVRMLCHIYCGEKHTDMYGEIHVVPDVSEKLKELQDRNKSSKIMLDE